MFDKAMWAASKFTTLSKKDEAILKRVTGRLVQESVLKPVVAKAESAVLALKDLVGGIDVEGRAKFARKGFERNFAAVQSAFCCGIVKGARGAGGVDRQCALCLDSARLRLPMDELCLQDHCALAR